MNMNTTAYRTRSISALAIVAIVALLVAPTAFAGDTPQSFDDLAPAGTPTDPGGGGGGYEVQITDRDMGAGVRVAVVTWIRGGVTHVVQQIWYADLDGDGQFGRNDRILFIRGGTVPTASK